MMARWYPALAAASTAALVAFSLALAGCGARANVQQRARVAPATRAQVDVAERHELARRHDHARAAYEKAQREAPDALSRAFAARRFASTLISWGEYRAAEERLETVAALAPGDASAWHDLGLLRHRRGDIEGARKALERAVAAAPRDARPAIALAALLVNQGERAAAAELYRQVLELPLPDRTRAAVERALVLLDSADSAAPGARAPTGLSDRPPLY